MSTSARRNDLAAPAELVLKWCKILITKGLVVQIRPGPSCVPVYGRVSVPNGWGLLEQGGYSVAIRGQFLSTLVVALCLTLSGASCSTPTGTISLAWGRVDHPAVTGYLVVYRPVTATESSSIFVEQAERNQTTIEATITGLESCTEYTVEIRSVGANARESAPSAEMTAWPRPEVHTLSPTELHRGSTARLTVKGDNFDGEAGLEFVNAGTALEGFTAVRDGSESNCKRLVFDVTIASTAPVGTFYVDVVNGGQVFGRSDQMVVVQDSSAHE